MTRVLKPCGTSAAYRRHLRHGEVPCEPCTHAEYDRRFPGKARRAAAQHGTASKYKGGCRCAPCTEAHTVQHRAWRESVADLPATLPEMVPHGVGGYRNYGCRCRVCTDAQNAQCRDYERRQREKAQVASC